MLPILIHRKGMLQVSKVWEALAGRSVLEDVILMCSAGHITNRVATDALPEYRQSPW